MSWFKKKELAEYSIPAGYSFKYRVNNVREGGSRLDSGNYMIADIAWFLYKGRSLVENGTHCMKMSERQPQVIMFLLGRRKAINHVEKTTEQHGFPLETGVTYEAPQTMLIDPYLASVWDPKPYDSY